ncbi:Hint domain-containing protein [Roseivivax sp.]
MIDRIGPEGQADGSGLSPVAAACTPCFTGGTLIKTLTGERPVEELLPGDRVLTRDNGFQTIRWVGKRHFPRPALEAMRSLAPVRIPAGSLGRGLPARDMMVSPEHRVLVGNAWTELFFAQEEVLIPARSLRAFEGVESVIPEEGVLYVNFLFAGHELVQSDGLWTESFQPGEVLFDEEEAPVRAEIFQIFPELEAHLGEMRFSAARPTLDAHQCRVLFAA